MKWVTRERPKIDRMACPWLILRFIDAEAEFLYVPADEVLTVAVATAATPYDIPGAAMSHVGQRCNFDTFLDHHQLSDPALQDLARIVRGADTDRLDLTPPSALRRKYAATAPSTSSPMAYLERQNGGAVSWTGC